MPCLRKAVGSSLANCLPVECSTLDSWASGAEQVLVGSGCRAASQRAAKHLTSVLWACLRSRGRAADVASEARCRTTICGTSVRPKKTRTQALQACMDLHNKGGILLYR